MSIMPGPCVVCGLKNYELSMGGPTICPSCDCGHFGPQQVEAQRREIERLRAENERLKRLVEESDKVGWELWKSSGPLEDPGHSSLIEREKIGRAIAAGKIP